MARLLWSLICRRAIVDENFKAVSLIDVLEGIDVGLPPGEKLSVIPVESAFVTLWTRLNATKPESPSTQRIRVIGPDGAESPPVFAPMDLSNHRNWRNVVQFRGITFRGPGDYTFVVELGSGDQWVEHSRVVLAVNLVSNKT